MVEYFEKRKNDLLNYSAYSFLRSVNKEILLNKIEVELNQYKESGSVIEIQVEGNTHFFFLKRLAWDSEYFGNETFRLFTVLYDHTDIHILCKAVKKFISSFFIEHNKYCFIEIPSEDILLIQALNSNGFRLVESRLTYYNNDVSSFSNERFPVRVAEINDIANLKSTASCMRNSYDRFHADSFFRIEQADSFLSTYIENSVKGFADIVLVPDEDGLPSDSFLTALYGKDVWDELGFKVSKMVLSAVSKETNQGWYKKLVSEMTYLLRDNIGAECIFMNTQSTNRAVINTWEKLGYKFGSCNHVLAFNS